MGSKKKRQEDGKDAGLSSKQSSKTCISPKKVKELYHLLRAGENRELELLLASLLKKGLDINKPLAEKGCCAGLKLIDEAVAWENHEAVRMLLESGAWIEIDPEQEPLMIKAVIKGSPRIVNLLLDHGADINQEDCHGRTAVYHAVLARSKPILAILLEKCAGPDSRDRLSGYTPLMLASVRSRDMSKMLINAGADVNAKDKSRGYSPLYLAAKKGRADIVGLLLDTGADINIQTGKGKTALHAAMYGLKRDVCELLIQRGADHTIKNILGLTPLETVKLSDFSSSADWPEELINGKKPKKRKKKKQPLGRQV